MTSFPKEKKRPNRLLWSFIAVSLAIHAVIFAHLSGIYKSRAISYIELSVQDAYRQFTREIPRPRIRPKEMIKPVEPERALLKRMPMPLFKPLKLEPHESISSKGIVEEIDQPDVSSVYGANIAEWNSSYQVGEGGDSGEIANAYLERVRWKIEKNKKYPRKALTMHIEGRVTVGFIISPSGDISNVSVVKTSSRDILDSAAIDAVISAAPFPPPPSAFKGEIPVEVVIVFELT